LTCSVTYLGSHIPRPTRQRQYAAGSQRVRRLTTDNRTLEERLTAARSNLRFQDHRVADLEAKLTDPASIT
jgi:hypothetical protein